MEEKKEPAKGGLRRTFLALVILILFPLITWYFLQQGLDHQRKTLAELKEYSKVGTFQLKDQDNRSVSNQSLKGRVSVVNFLPADMTLAKDFTGRIAKVHQSFNELDDVVFVTFVPIDSSNQLKSIASELSIRNEKQWYVLGASPAEWNELAAEAYKMPKLENSVALVDTSGTIRNYYDINIDQEMGLLVEQTVLVLPKHRSR